MPIDWNKPIETTCGKKARVIWSHRKSMVGRRYVVLVYGDVEDVVLTVSEAGTGMPYTLRNVPQEIRVTGYINVYPGRAHGIHKTREYADDVASNLDRIACIKIDVPAKEGQFDD